MSDDDDGTLTNEMIMKVPPAPDAQEGERTEREEIRDAALDPHSFDIITYDLAVAWSAGA